MAGLDADLPPAIPWEIWNEIVLAGMTISI